MNYNSSGVHLIRSKWRNISQNTIEVTFSVRSNWQHHGRHLCTMLARQNNWIHHHSFTSPMVSNLFTKFPSPNLPVPSFCIWPPENMPPPNLLDPEKLLQHPNCAKLGLHAFNHHNFQLPWQSPTSLLRDAPTLMSCHSYTNTALVQTQNNYWYSLLKQKGPTQTAMLQITTQSVKDLKPLQLLGQCRCSIQWSPSLSV